MTSRDLKSGQASTSTDEIITSSSASEGLAGTAGERERRSMNLRKVDPMTLIAIIGTLAFWVGIASYFWR